MLNIEMPQRVGEGYTSFEEVLKQADILTLHCALTETTKKFNQSRNLVTL